MASHLYEFGPYLIDVRKRRLERSDETVSLTSKTFDTLLVLVEHHGTSVSRSDLMARIWPDTAVGEHNLNQSIAALRKVLDDDPRQPTYIATVPGVGYRFIAEVREISSVRQVDQPLSDSSATPSTSSDRDANSRKSLWGEYGRPSGRYYVWGASLLLLLLLLVAVATQWGKVGAAFIPNRPQSLSVLPFANLESDSEDRYISEGLSQELAAELGQIAALKVVTGGSRAHTSDVDVRSVARELGVGTLLKGSVRRTGNDYRIAVELIDGNDGRQLWAKIFSISAAELPGVEEQIVRHTADVLRVPVATDLDQTIARRAGDNPEAHDLYLQGRYYWSKRDLQSMRKSFDLLQQAIAKDPHYARAYAGLADWYGVMAANQAMPVREAVAQARLAANKALELDPTMAEPHASLGLVNSLIDWDWEGAQVEYNRALLLNPGYGTAHHWAGLNLTAMGKFAEADAELRKAQELDPLSPMIYEGRAENFLYWHHFDRAMEVVRGMRARDGNPSAYALQFVMVEIAQGRYQEAYEELQKIDPANSERDVMALVAAQIRALMGDRRSAVQTVKKVEAKFRPGDLTATNIAFVYVALGEPDQAIRWLNRAYQQHDPMMAGIQWQPYLDPLKNDPRFVALMRKVEGAQLSAKN